MAQRGGLRRAAAAVGWAAVVCCWCPTIARAQSAIDGFDPGANDTVYAIAVQPDGKILVGGAFTMLGPVQAHVRLGR